MTPDIREKVVAEAKTWLRTPWHHRARVKGAGVDCVMLLCEVYESTGVIPHVEPEMYDIDVMLHRDGEPILAWLNHFGTPVDAPLPGDTAVYHFGRWFSHAGIVVDDVNLIHAFRQYNQVVITRLDEGMLYGRERRYYTMRG